MNQTRFSSNFLPDVLSWAPGLLLPEFQRGYVWTESDRLDLIDSIQWELPIGTIVIWEPDGPNFGPRYIIDGQQRLTSLLMIGSGASPARICLHNDPEDYLLDVYVPMDVVTGTLSKFLNWARRTDISDECMESADAVRAQFMSTRIGVCVVAGSTAYAYEVYRRMNGAGIPVDINHVREPLPSDGLTLGEQAAKVLA
jgi:hypothetical protein